MMKVFISHQKHDASLSRRIADRLKMVHQIESYLDVIDPYIDGPIETLADHIRTEMGRCTQLLAVISPATKTSQWVPWEVGVATEKDYPLATFSGNSMLPPEFLLKWPYLRTDSDLDEYARISKSTDMLYRQRKASLNESLARSLSTQGFYNSLRAALHQ